MEIGLLEMPSDPNAKTRVLIGVFALLFVIGCSVGAYFIGDLGKLQDSLAARESQAALQGITDANQLDEALRQNPSNKFLQMMAMATKAANETSAASEKLTSDIEPPAIAKAGNLAVLSRSDLEALRRDLKTAEANATAFLPRYTALLKAERDEIEKYALSLHLGKDTTRRLLDNLDKRHAEMTDLTSRILPARADYYRAYENYVAFLAREFGTYKVANGEFIFAFQHTVNRYNAAAEAMTVAAKRVNDLEAERRSLLKSQQDGPVQLVNGR
jgi:hypothetical protein